jgi:hypothetical protein
MGKRRKPRLVTQYLESISREALKLHGDTVKEFVGRRTGIYALYRRGKLYYAGLATNLISRLKRHLKDRHRDSWDSFSVYLTIGDKHMGELESLVLRMIQPPGNSQLGRFSGAEDLWREFEREIAAKQKAERYRLLMVDEEPEESTVGLDEPLRLRARYKGTIVRATLRRDLKVRLRGKLYDSPSGAALAVIKRPVNGWWFWQYERGPGDWVRIDQLRD